MRFWAATDQRIMLRDDEDDELDVSITRSGSKLRVLAPYHPAFVDQVQPLNGTFKREGRAWYFDRRDEKRVREICIGVYGTDGDGPVDVVTLRADVEAMQCLAAKSFWFGDRRVLSRSGRDSRVRLGPKCVLFAGGLPRSGGSRNYPIIGQCHPGTVLEIRDIPRSVAERLIKKYEGRCR